MKFSNPFRKEPSSEASGNTAVNPHLNAQRTWNDEIGGLVSSRQTWQIVAMVCLLIALVAIGGSVRLYSQSRITPYIVEVDKLGDAVAIRPAEASQAADPRVVRATVASFVSDARLVTPDIALGRAAVFRIYAILSADDPATAKMNQWLNGSPEANPFKRAETQMVSIEIKSVMPQTTDTWQIDWVETVRDRKGAVQEQPFRMRALVTVYVAPPTTEEQIRTNPLGIFVRDFSWTKQL